MGGRFVGSLAGDETAPGFVAFVDDFSRIFLVLGFTGESKRILGFAIRNLVDPK